jgi:hypothetical protein
MTLDNWGTKFLHWAWRRFRGPRTGVHAEIKEILRLRYDLGLRQDQIARSCNIGQSTVHRYLERFAAAAVSWPLPPECDEARLESLLFATRRGRPAGRENRRFPIL